MLGDKVKNLRKDINLTQEQLCEKIGIAQSTLGMIESNKREAGKKTLLKIADFFGVTVDYLLKEDDNNINEEEKKSVLNNFPLIPGHFTNSDEARAYVTKHQIFGYGGFNPSKMTDDEILDFANEMLNQAELLSIKYMNNKNR